MFQAALRFDRQSQRYANRLCACRNITPSRFRPIKEERPAQGNGPFVPFSKTCRGITYFAITVRNGIGDAPGSRSCNEHLKQ